MWGEVLARLVSEAPQQDKASTLPTVAAPSPAKESASAAEAVEKPPQGFSNREQADRAEPKSAHQPQGPPHTEGKRPTLDEPQQPKQSPQAEPQPPPHQASDLKPVEQTQREPPEPQAQDPPPPTPRPGTPRQPQRSRWPHFSSGP